MKQITDSIAAVVLAHNEMNKRVKGLTTLFNDVLHEHCDYWCKKGSLEFFDEHSCTNENNKMHSCCVAFCPLGKSPASNES